MPLTEESRPIADPAVVLREEFDDWAVLFAPDTGNAVGLNPTGVAIWKLLDGRRTVAEIAGELQTAADNAAASATPGG